MQRTTCSISAMDPAKAGAAKRGNMTAKAERDLRAAIMNWTDQHFPADTSHPWCWNMRAIYFRATRV